MSNKGISPIDATSEVGALRLLVGDTASIPLVPDEPGYADYATWSDDALQAALTAQSGNQLRAAGTLYLQLAAQYSLTGQSIKTDDLAIDTSRRGTDLRAIAQSFFDEAVAAEESAANDFFQIVPFAGRSSRNACVRPEGSPYPYC